MCNPAELLDGPKSSGELGRCLTEEQQCGRVFLLGKLRSRFGFFEPLLGGLRSEPEESCLCLRGGQRSGEAPFE